jgi:uroporphyrinogen-III decarboxylase
MEISSKEIVNNLFRLREVPRLPFIPWISSFAAGLEQVSIQDMYSDPGLLSTALLNAQELFGYDAITIGFDSSLEAEACGCELDWMADDRALPRIVSHPLSEGENYRDLEKQDFLQRGRIPVFLEALKRISVLRGKQVALSGVVTGPFTLARHLQGESFLVDPEHNSDVDKQAITTAGSVCLKLCRKYCETGVDVIVIADELLGRIAPELYSLAAPVLKSIWNVTGFFGRPSIITTTGCTSSSVTPALELGAAGFSFGPGVPASDLAGLPSSRKTCFGISLPLSATAQLPDINKPKKGYFLTTDREIPYTTPVEVMHRIMELVDSGRSN